MVYRFTGTPKKAEVSKVGTRWAELGSLRIRVDIHTLHLEGRDGHSSPGRCYLSLADYNQELRKNRAVERFRRIVGESRTFDGCTEAQVLEAAQALGFRERMEQLLSER